MEPTAEEFYSKLEDEIDECRAVVTHLINKVYEYRLECAVSEVILASNYCDIEKLLELEPQTADEQANQPTEDTHAKE